MQRNPYHKPSEDELKLAAKKAEKLANDKKEIEALANKCLNSKDFAKYRDKYEKRRALIIDTLIDYIEPDPIKYAFQVRVMLSDLRQLRLLLDNVVSDNRPRGKK